ncbi:MAG: hypothetical protein H8E31_08180 [Planctomycetes bacterium]|nr:hypothetical protein [Planctomycetota bacterium]
MRLFSAAILFGLSFGTAIAQDPGLTDNLAGLHGRSDFHPGGSGTGGRSAYDGLPVYHNSEALVCSDCHSMHASAQHDYAGGTGSDPFATGGYPWTTQPTSKLLKAPNSLDLCLACHDGHVGIPDVLGADVNGLTQRSGGHFEPPDTNPHTGHNLGYIPESMKGAWGYCSRCHFGGTFGTAQVECIDCHNKHGNHRARNLQWASNPGGEPPLGLFMDPAVGAAFGDMARYERANVAYGTLDSVSLREPSNICIDCHHTFSGGYYIDRNADGFHERHPAYDSERASPNTVSQGATKGSTDPGHWEGGTGSGFEVDRLRFVVQGADTFAAATAVSALNNGVFCLSCHYAHGSDQSFSLIWPEPEPGSGRRGCDQCHNKAGY